MKKIISSIPNGGAPWSDDTLGGILNGEVWTALESILQGISNPSASGNVGVIISGCNITANGGNWDCSSGIVYLSGQFMAFAGFTNKALPQYIYPASSVTIQKPFYDGINRNLITQQDATYQNSVPGSGQYIALTTTGINYPFGVKNPGGLRLENLLPPINPTWTNLTLINSWGVGGFSSTVPRYRIVNGKIRVSGGVNRTSGSNSIFANITGLTGLSISSGFQKMFSAFAYSGGAPITLQVAYASSSSISLGLLSATNATDYFFTIEFSPDDLDA